MPALCVGTQCGFSYEVPAALITGMTVVGLDIQATGTDLPLDITRITFGNQECMVTSNDATQISCGVANPISAGSWSVKVYTASGLVPVDALVANHDVALVVDSVSPTTLGSDGGEFVTFIGSGFPTGIETSD